MGSVIKRRFSNERRNGLKADLVEFARLFKSVVDPYRPELHYMRGPGPKWRAKHAVTSVEPPTLHGLARLQG
jgi:hypothetical protein